MSLGKKGQNNDGSSIFTVAKLQEMSKFPWEVLLNGRPIRKKIILRNLEPENLNFFLIENVFI